MLHLHTRQRVVAVVVVLVGGNLVDVVCCVLLKFKTNHLCALTFLRRHLQIGFVGSERPVLAERIEAYAAFSVRKDEVGHVALCLRKGDGGGSTFQQVDQVCIR